jgi:hypothetical protein
MAGVVEEAEKEHSTTINHEGMINATAFFARMYIVLR